MPERALAVLGVRRAALARDTDRTTRLQAAAESIRGLGPYRWVGIYDVGLEMIRVAAWSGPGPPAHLTFPVDQGLTGEAVRSRQPIVVGDVTADPRYLTTLEGTRSEAIFPVLRGRAVVGTLDVESDAPHAFAADAQRLLRECAAVLAEAWPGGTRIT